MIVSENTEAKEDTSITTYAGAITVAAILLLVGIRMGIVKGVK